MLIRSLLALLALVAVAFASTNSNPRQRLCAIPDNGGCTRVKIANQCRTWHGCIWIPKKKNKGSCFYDPECSNGKPHLTDSPTKAPTIPCRFPSAGCGTLSNQECIQYNGCVLGEGYCLDGGCQETGTPTRAPTACIDVPPEGCPSKNSLRGCEQWTCCSWIDNKAVCAFTPPTPPPTPNPPKNCQNLKPARCKKAKTCKLSGKKCVPK